jgi:hypothetical protein
MTTFSSNEQLESRLKTYCKAAGFSFPAIILWTAVCFKCVPVLASMFESSALSPGSATGFWSFSMFFVRHGFSMLTASIAIVVLLELFSRAWKNYRRPTVGVMVWLLNSIVICALASLFTVTVIVFPSLLK